MSILEKIFEYFKTIVKYLFIAIALLIALIIFYMFVQDFIAEPSNFQKITNDKEFNILESEFTGFMDPSSSMHFKTTPVLMNAFILEKELQETSKRKVDKYSDTSEWLSPPGVVTYYENTDYINSHQDWMDYKVDLRHNKDKTEGFYSSWSM
jgi:hypothetical protein